MSVVSVGRIRPQFRNNIVRWWGTLSYRKLKVTIEKRVQLCPLCQHELVEAEYLGKQVINTVRGSYGYVRDCWMPEKEDGLDVWKIVGE
jgi:hypothetical protein